MNPIMKIRRKARLAVAAGIASLIFGSSAFAEDLTLDVLVPYANSLSIMEPLSKRFTEENPDIKINFRLPPKNYLEADLELSRAAMIGNLPDVYLPGYAVFPHMVQTLSGRDQAVPLTDFMQAEGADWVASNYDDAMLQLGQVDGVQYALPFNVSSMIIFYNKELVQQAGHDPENFPQDWDQLIALAQDINKLGEDGVRGMDFSVGGNGSDFIWQTLVQSLGGKIVNDEGTSVGFDNDIGLQAFKIMQRMSKETDMTVATSVKGPRQQFYAGKLGFIFVSASGVKHFLSDVGDRFTLGTALFPITAKNGGLSSAGRAIAITAQDPEHKQAAWKYLKFMTGPEAQAFDTKNTGFMPINKKSFPLLEEFFEKNPNFATAFKQLEYARPRSTYAGGTPSEIWNAQSKIIDQVQRGNLSPEDGLKQMVEATNNLIK